MTGSAARMREIGWWARLGALACWFKRGGREWAGPGQARVARLGASEGLREALALPGEGQDSLRDIGARRFASSSAGSDRNPAKGGIRDSESSYPGLRALPIECLAWQGRVRPERRGIRQAGVGWSGRGRSARGAARSRPDAHTRPAAGFRGDSEGRTRGEAGRACDRRVRTGHPPPTSIRLRPPILS